MFNTQLQAEDFYDKAMIPLWVAEALRGVEHQAKFTRAVRSVERYRQGFYSYNSKNMRIAQMQDVSTKDIVMAIYTAILTIDTDVRPIQAVATALGSAVGYTETVSGVTTGAELLAVCKDLGIYELYSAFSDEHQHDTAVIKPLIELDSETRARIHMTQFKPPMLVQPDDWTNNRDGGYLINKTSVILGKGNHHNETQNLEILNTLQSIKWELNEWSLQQPELPKNPLDATDPEDLRKLRQHNARMRQSKTVYDFIRANGSQFYFVWKNDKRGRQNCQGYDINLQGSEYKKSIIQFAEKHIIPLTEEFKCY